MARRKRKKKNQPQEINENQFKDQEVIIEQSDNIQIESENIETQIEDITTNLRPKSKKITIIFAVIVWFFILSSIIASVFGYFYLKNNYLSHMPLYNKEKLIAEESSVIYDKEGNKIIELGMFLRDNINYQNLPENLIESFLSIEDSRFFTHNGFDVPRFLKALIENIKSKSNSQGGSTLDMQLIKNSYFVDDLTQKLPARNGIEGYIRKIYEIILSYQMNQELDKKEILSLYLNKLNFGDRIRGIEKASEYYFGKKTNELNLSEGALLAGLINLPNHYNPYYNLKNAKVKRDDILDSMYYHGYIDELELKLAKKIKVEDQLIGIKSYMNHNIPHYQSYIDAVVNEVIELTGKDPYYYSMEIYSNMDKYLQEVIYKIQNDGYEEIDFERDNIQSAIVLMNNKNGRIIALGGGRNQDKNSSRLLNRAMDSYISPGSSVKPFLDYAPAIDMVGWASSHTITDKPIFYRNSKIVVSNFNHIYAGDMLIDEALEMSLNTPAVQALEAVIDKVGIDKYYEYLAKIGYKNLKKEDFSYQYALGGYTFRTTVAQLAGAHAMLLNNGKYIKPHLTTKIILNKENKTINYDEKGIQAISPAAAYITSQLVKQVVYGPTSSNVDILGKGRNYTVYAKTGTSDWGSDGYQYGIPFGASKDLLLSFSNNEFTAVSWLGFDEAKKGEMTYFTQYDISRNIRAKIALKILDEIDIRFSSKDKPYKVEDLKRPDDVKDISHIKGLFPYATGEGEYISGLVDERYAKLVSLEEAIAYNQEKENTYTFNAEKNDHTINITYSGYDHCYEENGNLIKDISLSAYDITVNATGSCFFNLGNNRVYTAEIYKNDNLVEIINSDKPNFSYTSSDNSNITVCGFIGENKECVNVN